MPTYTSLLTAQPSFWEGIMRLMDFGNTLDEIYFLYPAELIDMLAIQEDMSKVLSLLRSNYSAVFANATRSEDEPLKKVGLPTKRHEKQ